MNNEAKNGMACSEFEALLADALDNTLAANHRQAFDEKKRLEKRGQSEAYALLMQEWNEGKLEEYESEGD